MLIASKRTIIETMEGQKWKAASTKMEHSGLICLTGEAVEIVTQIRIKPNISGSLKARFKKDRTFENGHFRQWVQTFFLLLQNSHLSEPLLSVPLN